MTLDKLFVNEKSVKAAKKGDELTFVTPGLLEETIKFIWLNN